MKLKIASFAILIAGAVTLASCGGEKVVVVPPSAPAVAAVPASASSYRGECREREPWS